ncbi:MAG: hypothetical protein M1814_006600 [Vezdaea aestivalis]|nr:MAG: hypothetical protein M1814_006600 [Vezdaea aestivalis]
MDGTGLPSSSSTELVLSQPTAAETWKILRDNASTWQAPLSSEKYLKCEELMSHVPLKDDGGMTSWILTTQSDVPDARPILASCETTRKRAIVAYWSEKENERGLVDTACHGVASVFCEDTLRGHGYSSRMIEELGKTLPRWQSEGHGGRTCMFSVLYSDIGKNFYARFDWHPFASSHLSLPPVTIAPSTTSLPKSRPLFTNDLPALCERDIQLLKEQLRSGSDSKTAVAVLPTIDIITWHHAKEDFVANVLSLGKPRVRGSIVGDQIGRQAWCIWTRSWYRQGPVTSDSHKDEVEENALQILRLVVEENVSTKAERIAATASLFFSAQLEAAKWNQDACEVWNVSTEVQTAAETIQKLFGGQSTNVIRLVERHEESIPSLRWYGNNPLSDLQGTTWKDIDWIANEKYAWY